MPSTASDLIEGLDPQVCYRALETHDPRFDGRFFSGVHTTGVFCRPICTAKLPKPENVSYYPSATAASDAGFRPCLRCRPEAAPGSPGWVGTEATVRRALRRIAEGALDECDMEEFASRLGIGPRHLRRLFDRHVGANPSSVAKLRRVLFAKSLIHETPLSMTEIALSAGFGSVRRFNAAMRDVYGRPPSELRRSKAARTPSDTESIVLTLSTRPPMDWDGLIGFLAPRAIPGVENVFEGEYRRTFRIGDERGVVVVRPKETGGAALPCVELTVRGGSPAILMDVVERTRRVFDLDAVPETVQVQLSRDKRLKRSVKEHPGLRVPGAWDIAELAVRAVLGQQVTVVGATTMAGRIAEEFGETVEVPGQEFPSRIFPTAERLVDADFSRVGIPKKRQETLRNVARAICEDGLLGEYRSLEELVERWTQVPGIGAWTAHYIAMRGYQEPDAFPSSDLGVRKALSHGEVLISARDVERVAEAWRPWRAYAAMHLWASL